MTNLTDLIKQEREYIEKEFVARGADIEGMLRVEYRQLREKQVDSLMDWLESHDLKLIQAVKELAEGMTKAESLPPDLEGIIHDLPNHQAYNWAIRDFIQALTDQSKT